MKKQDTIRRKIVFLRILNTFFMAISAFLVSFTDGRFTRIEIIVSATLALGVFFAGIQDIIGDEINFAQMQSQRNMILSFY